VKHQKFIFYPRDDGKLYLGDYALVLSLHGIKESKEMELYQPDDDSWHQLLWDRPLIVKRTSQVYFLRISSVKPLSFARIFSREGK
jgi:hypothetical protein